MRESETHPSTHADPIKGQFWTLWSASLINRLGTFVIPFMVLFLTEGRSFSVTEAALVVSVVGAGSLVGGAAGGVLSDLFGRKQMILATLIGSAVFIGVFVSMQSYAGLITVAFFMGLALDAYRPAAAAAIVDATSEQNRTKAFGYLAWGANVGATGAPLMGGFIIAYFSYRAAYYVDAAACLGAAITIFFFYKNKPTARVKHRIKLQSHVVALRNVSSSFLIYLGLIFLAGVAGTQAFATLPLSIVDAGMSEKSYGMVMGSSGAFALVLGLPAARLIPRLPRHVAMAASLLIAGLGMSLFVFTSSLGGYIGAIMIWTVGVVLFMPLGPTIAQHLAGDVGAGFVQSMYATAHGLAALFGPILGGVTYQYLGEGVLWPACGVLVAMVGVGFIVMERRHPGIFGAPHA